MEVDLAIIPLVTALVMAVKQAPPLKPEARRWMLPWIAIGLAVGASFLLAQEVTGPLALQGVVYGLAAAGLYDVPKAAAKAKKAG